MKTSISTDSLNITMVCTRFKYIYVPAFMIVLLRVYYLYNPMISHNNYVPAILGRARVY